MKYAISEIRDNNNVTTQFIITKEDGTRITCTPDALSSTLAEINGKPLDTAPKPAPITKQQVYSGLDRSASQRDGDFYVRHIYKNRTGDKIDSILVQKKKDDETKNFTKAQFKNFALKKKVDGVEIKNGEITNVVAVSFMDYCNAVNGAIPYAFYVLCNHIITEIGEFGANTVFDVIISTAKGNSASSLRDYGGSQRDYLQGLISDVETAKKYIPVSAFEELYRDDKNSKYVQAFDEYCKASQGSLEEKQALLNKILVQIGAPDWGRAYVQGQLYNIGSQF